MLMTCTNNKWLPTVINKQHREIPKGDLKAIKNILFYCLKKRQTKSLNGLSCCYDCVHI
ncbi:hypothetical protein GLYMA_01G028400v4 [Glycine max]|uniref:Uncharacterized protein n=2 Tax=Glycine subgen. Soja TaxID=1462606 RepID=A0A0R0LBV2_SOYBN|nr:hypothetical protein GYH30_000295 [Glycine max]KRH74563.1 hypothetical protein GLYMA_01G028400v4 [Glycine max]RZC28202.1 hypothetical protein D0Y65_000283 [Glycine soja]